LFRLFLITLLVTSSWEIIAQDQLQKYQYSRQAMGTTFALTFYASSQETADAASSQAWSRIDDLNKIFSDYLETSEISELSKMAGQKVAVSDDLWYLLNLSKQISRHSNGAFDVTIGPVTKLWRRAIRQQEFPDSNKIAQALALVNYRWIKLYPAKKQVKLKKLGMKLDFGGIAKGYAIDKVFQVLQRFGIHIALIDGGGDLLVSADPPDGSSWVINDHQGKPIEIEPPVALASSGDQYRYLLWNGKRFSHIVDPSDGMGLQHGETVTVAAVNATLADALASATSVLKRDRQNKLLKKYQAKLVF
jgi:thiamine biosynthesis lipoprotein